MTLGERIRQLRQERDWSLTFFARALPAGRSRSHIYGVETDTVNPTLRWIEDAAHAFGISVLQMLAPLYGYEAKTDAKWDELNDALTRLHAVVSEIDHITGSIAGDELLRRNEEDQS